MPLLRLACVALPCAALLAGCAAAKAQLEILSAEDALRRAEEYDAERLAPYEHTLAEAYLGKAREQAGFSAYRVADALARRSAQWSDRAIIFVERRGRAEVDLGSLSDRPAAGGEPEAPPTPAPRDEIEALDDELDIDEAP